MHYTPGRIYEEAALVTERVNAMEATRAILIHAAGSAIMSKKSHTHFDKLIKSMIGS